MLRPPAPWLLPQLPLVTRQYRSSVWTMRNVWSAPTAMELALDPLNPVLVVPSNMKQPATTLKKWQLSGACWVLRQEASPVATGILADACSTGKTTTAITTMWYASVRAEKDPAHTHRPTLILCPSALIDTWLTELMVRFGDAFPILLFHGHSAHTSNYTWKSLTVDKLADLEAQLQRLDDHDMETSRTIVLSSYSTWAACTVTEVTEVKGKGKDRQVDGAEDSEDENPNENTLAIEQLALLQETAETANDRDMDEAEEFGSS
ncbi:putative DNA helicase ino80 [Aspergillus udagawae]|nr:putative DNA helicase ino80 [Aspergillus udagawae]